VLLLLLAWACGGSSPQLDAARREIARGELERAARSLEGLEGRAAERLRRELEEARARDAELQQELERAAALEPSAELERLRELLERAEDPVVVERLEAAVSKAADRAAAGSVDRRAARGRAEREARSRSDQLELAERPSTISPERISTAGTEREASAPRVQDPPARPQVEPETSAELAGAGREVAEAASEPETEASAVSIDTPAPVLAREEVEIDLEPWIDAVLADVERAERALLRAGPDRRDEAFSALNDLGEHAAPALARAVGARFEEAQRALLKSPSLKSLERVAEHRRELDELRAEALELIFDEEEYFYPFQPPSCPPEKARHYWPVQRQVDERVEAVRDHWERPRVAKVAKSFFVDRGELEWCRQRGEELGLTLVPDAQIPSWALLVTEGAKSWDTTQFAWDEGEARRLANDRAVRDRNLALWVDEQQEELDENRRASVVEQRQVEITNEYRRMLGRSVLAWNPLLQASSEMHSVYMARTGDFGHEEEGDPARRTPFDRMRLVGYERGISENCNMGGGSPQGAHDGWCHSSGHHRNLLMEGHTEMASAADGRYWTQNFGTDTTYRSEIDTWQD